MPELDLRDRIRAEKGRQLYRLAHADLTEMEMHEARGSVAALTGVLDYMANGDDRDEDVADEYAALGGAEQALVETIFAEADDGPPNTMGVQ